MATRPEHTLVNKGKLIVSKELQSKILYLHSQVKDVEWSGWLIYKILEGTVSKPSELVCEAVDLVVKDVGSSAYTEYEFDATDVEIYENYPGLMSGELKRGHIHTHHNMTTFFSGTDTDELHDNAPYYPYYLSLIVNHKSLYCAKIAILGMNNSRISFNQGKDNIEFEEEESLVIINMDIEIEQEVEFKSKVAELLKPKPVARSITRHYANENTLATLADQEDLIDSYSQLDEIEEEYYNSWIDKTVQITTWQGREFLTKLMEEEDDNFTYIGLETVLRRVNARVKTPLTWAKHLMTTRFDVMFKKEFATNVDYEDALETCSDILKSNFDNPCAVVLHEELRKELQLAKKQ